MSALRKRLNQRLTMPGVKEAIREPLYDFLTYDSAATLSLRFFQEPQGGPSSKTEADTNMTMAGQIPAGWKFSAEMLEVYILPGSNASSYVRELPVKSGTSLAAPNFANDVWALVNRASVKITIGSKPYATLPLLKAPPTVGLEVKPAVAVENTNTTVLNQLTADYARLAGRPFVFDPILPIPANTNFDVTITWPAAVTLPSGFDCRIGVVLDGIRFRDA